MRSAGATHSLCPLRPWQPSVLGCPAPAPRPGSQEAPASLSRPWWILTSGSRLSCTCPSIPAQPGLPPLLSLLLCVLPSRAALLTYEPAWQCPPAAARSFSRQVMALPASLLHGQRGAPQPREAASLLHAGPVCSLCPWPVSLRVRPCLHVLGSRMYSQFLVPLDTLAPGVLRPAGVSACLCAVASTCPRGCYSGTYVLRLAPAWGLVPPGYPLCGALRVAA